MSHENLSDDSIKVWQAFHDIWFLFSNQRKLQEVEEMFQRARAEEPGTAYFTVSWLLSFQCLIGLLFHWKQTLSVVCAIGCANAA